MIRFQCAVLLSIGYAFDGINLFTKILLAKRTEAIVRGLIDGVYSDGFSGGQQRSVDLNGRNGGDMVVILIVVAAALMVVPAVTSCSGGGCDLYWRRWCVCPCICKNACFHCGKKIYEVAYR